ncbi:MAG TPA: site-2 protease family protein [Ignavibacteriales bacterium]|nr:site-2 protease family protein [Ignavibacteriales bacterium]HOL81576.1 site-2 protease family protein [Ignavibacteriales bacterium]HOM65594.1 site-2 protease family protein [Ignavibacteriales bacterium]HPD67802.1 site-2 protease family protein [Ignavibacteriales bacterium]HPP33690.1 site-2 protease family protein [Ignavibacteriales bacterium]
MKKITLNWLNILLFILTFITTTFAGAIWRGVYTPPFTFTQVMSGLEYSFSIMFIILAHEYGHYFASKYHRVDCTHPYMIPVPPFLLGINFGTMGAFIKTKSQINFRKSLFDIGAYGPLAGFVATVIILIYGYSNLPSKEYILAIHRDYFNQNASEHGIELVFGNNLLLYLLNNYYSQFYEFIPPMSEIYHYPYLCAGWLGLFITSMNLIPVGQLDGGHITYAVFGQEKHYGIAKTFTFALIFLGINGLIGGSIGSEIWLIWALILKFIIKEHHPPIMYFENNLTNFRKLIAVIILLIFILSFTPNAIFIRG